MTDAKADFQSHIYLMYYGLYVISIFGACRISRDFILEVGMNEGIVNAADLILECVKLFHPYFRFCSLFKNILVQVF